MLSPYGVQNTRKSCGRVAAGGWRYEREYRNIKSLTVKLSTWVSLSCALVLVLIKWREYYGRRLKGK